MMMKYIQVSVLILIPLLASDWAVVAFQTPLSGKKPHSYNLARSSTYRRTSCASLRVSSSADNNTPDDSVVENLMTSAAANAEPEVGQEATLPTEWVNLVGPGIIAVVGIALLYTVATFILVSAGDMTASAASALGDALLSLMGTLAVAAWEGLQVVVPIIVKIIVSAVQVAIPVIRDVSHEVAMFATPYVEEAKSEVAVVAAPYVDQWNDALHQAADATIVQPMQEATETLARTVDTNIIAPIQDAKENFRSAVHANVMAPIQGVKESVTSAVDDNILMPIQEVKEKVDSFVAPIQQVTNDITNTLSTSPSPMEGGDNGSF